MKTISLSVIALLSALPAFVYADPATTDGYLSAKPLVLEVRYCQCPAMGSGGEPTDLLPAFLDASSMLQVGVDTEDKGFVASDELSMGYAIKAVPDRAGAFRFDYTGVYATAEDTTSGRGELVLEESEWVLLFSSTHDTGSGMEAASVAVRLLPVDGS